MFGVVSRKMEKRNKRSRDVTAKRVGLISPIKATRSSGVVGEIVFRLMMVFQGLSYPFMLFFFFVIGVFHR